MSIAKWDYEKYASVIKGYCLEDPTQIAIQGTLFSNNYNLLRLKIDRCKSENCYSTELIDEFIERGGVQLYYNTFTYAPN